MPRRHSLLLTLLIAWIGGCATTPTPPMDWLERLSNAPPPPPDNAFPLPPDELERVMHELGWETRSAERTGSGITGAWRVEAYHPASDRALTFKWKTAPEGGEGWNNSPRLEIAAYAIQKWFLDPQDYVVPPVVGVCIPLEAYGIDDDDEPAFEGTECIFGTRTIWLEGVTRPEVLLDEWRFYRDPNYARHLANYNLLTYLIRNRDSRSGNFLVSRNDSNRRVYSVDNGIAFGSWLFNYFVPHWDRIRVPALPRSSIDRLRRVTSRDLEALSVVAQLEADRDAVLHPTQASTAFERHEGVRMRDGVVQLGLEPGEIDAVRERLHELINAVDERRIPAF